MKRATITVSDEIASAIDAYRRDQELPTTLTAVAEAALAEYLSQRGYLKGPRSLHITPWPRGSGHKDTSIEHDSVLAGE